MKTITNKVGTNMKKIVSYLLIATGFFLFFANLANAKECRTIYGGGEVCETGDLSLDKKVFNPKANEYWDNIDSKDFVFAPGEEVKFSLRIKNISNIKIDSARINDDFDRLDDYMVYVSSDKGDYRAAVTDHKIKFDFGGLEPGKEVTVYFVARFKAEGELPVGTTCITNAAHAYSHDDGVSDSDYASFCVKTDNGKIITKTTPATGFDLSNVLMVEALAFAGIGAVALRKAKSVVKRK
jgi:hypothetical protein